MRPLYMYSDYKIALIRKHIFSIWYSCFGEPKLDDLCEPVSYEIFERIKNDPID